MKVEQLAHLNGFAAEGLHTVFAYLSNVITIQAALLEVLASVGFQGLAFIQGALPAIIPLLVGRLHALAVYTEGCGAPKLLACSIQCTRA